MLVLWNTYQRAMNASVVLGQAQSISINKGDSFNTISNKLGRKIAINQLWFKFIAYKEQVANTLKAGEYELKVGSTLPQIVALFAAGKTKKYTITFPEGWRFAQIIERIQSNPQLKKTLSNDDLQTLITQLDARYQHPEGWFFPATYFFDKNATDLSVLTAAHHKMQRVLQTEWAARQADLPLDTAYQALILASIVEKEAQAPAERAQIAGVFIRRLKKRMLLQADPTVIYGMGERYRGNIRYRDLRQRTAYNTYVIKGLPSTPIAMPGQAAIHAVLHPAAGNSLYFVAQGNEQGTHVFSATLKQHNNAVNKYQKKRRP